MQLIELRGVGKEFSAQSILREVNITISEGDILGIIGESGSGKTTLLNLMVGYLRPSDGEVLYYSKVTQEPKSLHDNLHRIKKYIGFSPQHNSYYPRLTVVENLLHFGQIYKVPRPTLINNIKSLLEFTALHEHRNKLAEHLSGGMQKRLNVSCSLVHKPKLLFLDEPTADLDPKLQKEILHLIQEVHRQGVTVIIASHHMDSIEAICNKVAIIHKGSVFSYGSIDDIKKPFLRDYFTINLRPGDSKEKIISMLRQLPVQRIMDHGSRLVVYPSDTEKTINRLLAFIKEENLYLHDLDLRKPSLSEVFEEITGSAS